MKGEELRKTALVLAQNNYTPVNYWTGIPLVELSLWLDANNTLIREQNERRKKG